MTTIIIIYIILTFFKIGIVIFFNPDFRSARWGSSPRTPAVNPPPYIIQYGYVINHNITLRYVKSKI